MEPAADRNKKREEILEVARTLFLEDGYDAASMSRIARAAGVAPNTIYWHFADKDALLIAVLEALVSEGVREFQRNGPRTLEAQLTWLLETFERTRGLITTVHARLGVSEALRAWHERFHALLEAMLVAQLRAHGVDPAHLPHASRVAMFVVEGLLAHPTSPRKRDALIGWMVSALG